MPLSGFVTLDCRLFMGYGNNHWLGSLGREFWKIFDYRGVPIFDSQWTIPELSPGASRVLQQ
jgi:hypothetical protein